MRTSQVEGPGEQAMHVMRFDRSVNTETDLYSGFSIYAGFMLFVYPIGVPALYFVLFYRNRHVLRHLRRLELMQEKDFSMAILNAEGAESDKEAMAIMKGANDAHAAAVAQNEHLRGQLPTALRRLTAGYSMQTYWCVDGKTDPLS